MNILWTIGDTSGIGCEIILKARTYFAQKRRKHVLIAVGSASALKFYSKLIKSGVKIEAVSSVEEAQRVDKKKLPVIDIDSSLDLGLESGVRATHQPSPGVLSRDAGILAMRSIEAAAQCCLRGEADAMVTAPINKEAIHLAGYAFQGHTDFLAHLCGVKDELMLLVDEKEKLRVALVTVHLPLGDVAPTVREKGINIRLSRLASALQTDFGIGHPRIAVLGLNPHSSDNGVIGNDEQFFIQPALAEWAKANPSAEVEGCFAADAFFGMRRYKHFDAVLAMYHDQGLIAFKLLAFETGVNITAGLPIVRTSPDHGTAFDIAGKGKANATSFVEATKLAVKIATARQQAQD